MAATAIEQHDDIFLHCMSVIEKPEYNDGSVNIYQMLSLNEIDTILGIMNIENKGLKAVYT